MYNIYYHVIIIYIYICLKKIVDARAPRTRFPPTTAPKKEDMHRTARRPPPKKGGTQTDRTDRQTDDICLSDCRPYSELIGTRSACTQSSNDHCESRAITSPSRDRCSSQREQSRDSHQKKSPLRPPPCLDPKRPKPRCQNRPINEDRQC